MYKNILIIVFTLNLVFALDRNSPPMGWNSWNHFSCWINEDVIKKAAETLVSSGLAAKGYIYVNLDDCWQMSRDENGKIVEDKKNFPSGMKALADYIHSLGLKFGLYSSAGTKTCQGRPGSLGYEENDANSYAEWGVDYLKYDNCFNEGISGKIRFPKMRDAILKSGRDIFYSLCQWGEEDVVTWGSDVGNSWRTTGDIQDSWRSFIGILDKQVGLEVYVKPGGFNDPDMLEVGNGGMTENEYQAHFALWALLKAPLLIGCDLTNMSPSTISILTNSDIIAINQDPLYKQGRRASRVEKESGPLEIWTGELTNGFAIILFNRSLKKENMTVIFKDLGFQYPGGNLRNLITHVELGYVENSYSADVEPHSVVVLKLQNSSCTEFLNCIENNLNQ